MSFKELLIEHIEHIPQGEWNFADYRRRERKPINIGFTLIDYIAQLPYIRAITGPIMMVVFIPVFAIWLAYQCIKETVEGR